MTAFQQGIITLTSAAIIGKVSELPEDFSCEKLDLFAKKHQISSILLYGLVAIGHNLSHPAVKNLYVRSGTELLSDEKQLAVIDSVRSLLNSNGVSFVFLKGAVVKNMYPKTEMRVMGDIDILIKKEEYEKIKKLLTENGYFELYESDHEIAWKSSEGVLLELHKALIPSYHDDFYAYFGDGWSFARKRDGVTEHCFSAEDHYLYIFTHFAKHYKSGGIGVKHLIDLFVYKRHFPNMDFTYIETELNKINLLEFHNNVLKTEEVWFDGKAGDSITDKITEVLIKSGAYGTHSDRANAEALRISRSSGEKKVSKFRLLMRKIFPSASVLAVKYKFLRKCKLLLPIAWFIRWFDALFNKRENIKRHANDIKAVSDENISSLENDLALVGLKYSIKEKG